MTVSLGASMTKSLDASNRGGDTCHIDSHNRSFALVSTHAGGDSQNRDAASFSNWHHKWYTLSLWGSLAFGLSPSGHTCIAAKSIPGIP